MLLFIIALICVFLQSSGASGCISAEHQPTDPYSPTIEINTIEYPDEHILPIGYNVTIACISNSSKSYPSFYGKPFWMQYYFNDEERVLHECGGADRDSETSKVCRFFILNGTKNDSARYTCWSHNQMTCTEDTLQLEFKEPQAPSITADLPNQLRVMKGNKSSLTCRASGVPRPVISWFKNGHLVTSSSINGVKTQSTLTFDPVSRNDQGRYWCEATSFLGSRRSRTATLTVLEEPIFLIHPLNVSATADDGGVLRIIITCAVEGFPKPVVSWLENNSTIINETGNKQNGTLSFLSITFHEKGKLPKYRCIARNPVGVALSTEATITILDSSSKSTIPDGKADTGEDSASSILWSAVSIAVAVLLLVLVTILIIIKQKQWRRAHYRLNVEMVAQQELIQLHIKNDMDTINQLRLSQGSINTSSSQNDTMSTTDGQEVVDNELYLQTMDTSKRNWEIPRNRITITQEKLGGGEFGIVNKGVYLRNDGHEMPVAVKQLRDNSDQQERISLIQELKTLIRVGRHPNIVSLVGACTFEEPLCVVTEFVSGGSLEKLLKASHVQNRGENASYANIWSKLTERELLGIASDVANGMKYLERKKCVHRDLASRNVLVGSGLVAKVADFGMARDVSTDGQYIKATEGRIPWLWMSMEALRGISTIKGDVWSFGVVLWEIVTLGELPYRGVRGLVELHDSLQDGVRLGKPPHCSQELYDVMLQCWNKSPDERPTFEELFATLQEILHQKERTYINVTFFEEDVQILGEI